MAAHGIKGTIKFFGTPAEETLVGKIYMGRDGVFDGQISCSPGTPGDTNGVSYGTNLAIDNIKFSVLREIVSCRISPGAAGAPSMRSSS